MDIYGTHRTAQEKELKSATVAAAVDTVDYHSQNLRMNNRLVDGAIQSRSCLWPTADYRATALHEWASYRPFAMVLTMTRSLPPRSWLRWQAYDGMR